MIEIPTVVFILWVGATVCLCLWLLGMRFIAQRDYFIGRIDEKEGAPLPPANKKLGRATP